MSNRRECFGPKSHGYGAGLPIAWQSWVLLVGYLAVVIGGALLFAATRPIILFSVVVVLTAMFIWVARNTTRGGWRWRWGERG